MDAALEIVDEVGTDAFSMRLLADRLGSGTATLYRHLAGKDELMAYVVDRILGEVDVETDADMPAIPRGSTPLPVAPMPFTTC